MDCLTDGSDNGKRFDRAGFAPWANPPSVVVAKTLRACNDVAAAAPNCGFCKQRARVAPQGFWRVSQRRLAHKRVEFARRQHVRRQ